MTTETELQKYGFREVNGAWMRYLGATVDLTTERWIRDPSGTGWYCFKQGPVDSFGKPTSTDGVFQVPHSTRVSGAHPQTTPDDFEWVWPDATVEAIYKYAEEGWVKTASEDGTFTFTRE